MNRALRSLVRQSVLVVAVLAVLALSSCGSSGLLGSHGAAATVGSGGGSVKIVEGTGFCTRFQTVGKSLDKRPTTRQEAAALAHAAANDLRTMGSPAAVAGDVGTIANALDHVANEVGSGASVNALRAELTARYGLTFGKAIGGIALWMVKNCH